MGRLIDADALRYEPLPRVEKNYRPYTLDDAYEDGYDDAFENIMNAPTVDAKPIRHGRWIEHHETDLGMILKDYIECSECRVWFTSQNMFRRSFCPNCGARMDEE